MHMKGDIFKKGQRSESYQQFRSQDATSKKIPLERAKQSTTTHFTSSGSNITSPRHSHTLAVVQKCVLTWKIKDKDVSPSLCDNIHVNILTAVSVKIQYL